MQGLAAAAIVPDAAAAAEKAAKGPPDAPPPSRPAPVRAAPLRRRAGRARPQSGAAEPDSRCLTPLLRAIGRQRDGVSLYLATERFAPPACGGRREQKHTFAVYPMGMRRPHVCTALGRSGARDRCVVGGSRRAAVARTRPGPPRGAESRHMAPRGRPTRQRNKARPRANAISPRRTATPPAQQASDRPGAGASRPKSTPQAQAGPERHAYLCDGAGGARPAGGRAGGGQLERGGPDRQARRLRPARAALHPHPGHARREIARRFPARPPAPLIDKYEPPWPRP